MDKKELRIGNKVTVKTHDSFRRICFTVASLSDRDHDTIGLRVVDSEIYRNVRPSYIIPISLNEQILLKAGFQEVNPRRGTQKAFKFKGVRIEMSNSGNFYYKGNPKPYVHKIQNLVYELTDQELEINL